MDFIWISLVFPQMIFLSSRIQHTTSSWPLSVLCSVTVPVFFSLPSWPWNSSGHIFWRKSPSLDLSDVFLWLWGFGFGDNSTDEKYTFIYSIKGEVCDSNMGIPWGVNLDHLIKVVLARFPHSIVPVSPFSHVRGECKWFFFNALNLFGDMSSKSGPNLKHCCCLEEYDWDWNVIIVQSALGGSDGS